MLLLAICMKEPVLLLAAVILLVLIKMLVKLFVLPVVLLELLDLVIPSKNETVLSYISH